jgi:3-phosphoshikimate 1-carboxyvinyltransferase
MPMARAEAVVEKIRNADVCVEAPPAKAHSLRALILASLADGESIVERPLLAEDQINVIECLRRLGIEVERERGDLRILGRSGRYAPVGAELDVGDSGVGMNFLCSAACLADVPVIIGGSRRLNERPIGEIVSGLRQLGCRIDFLEKEGCPPVRVHGGGIPGGTARMHGALTSQYFSSLVIAAPCARGPVTVQCLDEMSERPYLDISLGMMSEFGVEAENDRYREMRLPGGARYRPRRLRIEGDYSSASFFFLAAAVCRSRVRVTGLRADTRQGDRRFLDLLARMGCAVSTEAGAVVVRGGELRAIDAEMGDLPDLVPPMAVAAAFAEGTSRFTDIARLRVKESDRVAVLVSELARMGVPARCDADSLTVTGTRQARGARIDPHNDHRIAMSFAVAGLVTGGQVIENPGCVAKSFPDFWERFGVFAENPG